MALPTDEKLTTEEKLAILQKYENWMSFTDPQRVFLEGIAHGLKPSEAFIKAYPDTKHPALIFATQQMMCRVGIKKALSLIGIDTRKPIVSRLEALELMSGHLRRIDDPALLVRVLNAYQKLAGWNDKIEQKDTDEVPLEKLVAAVEKKRRKEVAQ